MAESHILVLYYRVSYSGLLRGAATVSRTLLVRMYGVQDKTKWLLRYSIYKQTYEYSVLYVLYYCSCYYEVLGRSV